MTIHYEVALDAAPGQVNELTRFMIERHIGDMLETGCFVSAHFMQESTTRFRTAYVATSRDALDRYVLEHAPRIRAEFSQRFGDTVRLSRSIWEPRGDWWISLGAQASVQTTAERLLGDLRRSHNGDAWHGPALSELITQADAAMAAAHPIPGAHSIWELTRHLSAWVREVADRLSGKAPGQPMIGDWPAIEATSDAAWQAAQLDLRSAHGELLGAVASFPSARWDAAVGPGDGSTIGVGLTFAGMVSGVAQHNAYHGGQIALLLRAVKARAMA